MWQFLNRTPKYLAFLPFCGRSMPLPLNLSVIIPSEWGEVMLCDSEEMSYKGACSIHLVLLGCSLWGVLHPPIPYCHVRSPTTLKLPCWKGHVGGSSGQSATAGHHRSPQLGCLAPSSLQMTLVLWTAEFDCRTRTKQDLPSQAFPKFLTLKMRSKIKWLP